MACNFAALPELKGEVAMTNDEARMTKELRCPNDNWPKKHRAFTAICHLDIFSSLGFRHSSFSALSFLIVTASSLALLCGCASSHKPSKPHVIGKIIGNSYTSPQGRFSVPCPVSPEVGGRILRDNAQGVTFTDNWGSKITIYSTPFNAQSQMMDVLQTQGS